MRPSTRYSLASERDRGGMAELVRDGRPVQPRTCAALLETQFDLDDGRTLVWLTDGSPHDEGLHVRLLNDRGEIEDAVDAGADMTPGILRIEATGATWVRFRFFDNSTTYRLEVAPHARPRAPLPPGWRYTRMLRLHRLVVRTVSPGEP